VYFSSQTVSHPQEEPDPTKELHDMLQKAVRTAGASYDAGRKQIDGMIQLSRSNVRLPDNGDRLWDAIERFGQRQRMYANELYARIRALVKHRIVTALEKRGVFRHDAAAQERWERVEVYPDRIDGLPTAEQRDAANHDLQTAGIVLADEFRTWLAQYPDVQDEVESDA